MSVGPLIFVIAGEPSGDAIGARLMAALKRATGDTVRFAGIGGAAMQNEGLRSIFPMNELSVMGLVEVLPHARGLLARIAETARAIDAMQPAAVVSIDSPSFAIRVAKRIRSRAIPRIHYVAPTVWAWRPWRVHAFKKHFDCLLCLLPFEPPWFDRVGMPCRFVGHPVLEYGAADGDGQRFRRRHGIAADASVLCVLPGSRRGEVSRLAGDFGETLRRLAIGRAGLVAVLPTVETVADHVTEIASGWPTRTVIVRGAREKYDAMAASQVALAASGTVALETAIAGVPTVVAYRISAVTAYLLRRLVKVRFANLINLILDREVIPELLQEECRPDRLVAEVERLFGPAGAAQVEAARPALIGLGLDDLPPSHRAAAAILDIIAAAQTSRAEQLDREGGIS